LERCFDRPGVPTVHLSFEAALWIGWMLVAACYPFGTRPPLVYALLSVAWLATGVVCITLLGADA
jgi:hypothetical protein